MKKDSIQELLSAFDGLYDKGYRFLDTMDKVEIGESTEFSRIITPLKYKDFSYEGKKLTDEQKERVFNLAAFLMSIARKVEN